MLRRRLGPGVGRPVMRAAATTAVVAGTAAVVGGHVRRHQDQKWAAEEQAQYEHQVYEQQQAALESQPAAAAQPAYMVELGKLAELKNQGLITEEEFQTKKKQILGI